MLLSEHPSGRFFYIVWTSVGMFWTSFAPSNYTMLSEDWSGPKPNLVFIGIELDEVGKFCWLVVSSQQVVVNRTERCRAYIMLHWYLPICDIYGVDAMSDYQSNAKSTLQRQNRSYYTAQKHLLWEQKLWRFPVFKHCCLRCIARMWRENHTTGDEVKILLLDIMSHGTQYVEQMLSLNRLKLLGYVVCMCTGRLTQCMLSSETVNGWKADQRRHSLMWQKGLKT